MGVSYKKINLEDVQMNTKYVRCVICDDFFEIDSEVEDICSNCEDNVNEALSDFYVDKEEE